MDQAGPLVSRWLRRRGEARGARRRSVSARHGVKRIVIGHSATSAAVLPRFGGKVVLIDVGLSKVYGGPPACLILEKAPPTHSIEARSSRCQPIPRA